MGDKFTMTAAHVKKLNEKNGYGTHYYDSWVGRTGKLYAHRLNRFDGHMCILWGDGSTNNCYFLEDLGYKIEEQQFDEIPLMDAPLDLLFPEEKVIREMVNSQGITVEMAIAIVESVKEAMQKHGVVFYIP